MENSKSFFWRGLGQKCRSGCRKICHFKLKFSAFFLGKRLAILTPHSSPTPKETSGSALHATQNSSQIYVTRCVGCRCRPCTVNAFTPFYTPPILALNQVSGSIPASPHNFIQTYTTEQQHEWSQARVDPYEFQTVAKNQ